MFAAEENQGGSITVIAMVTLVLLTVMGISLSMITTVDIRIYGNERSFKENFYLAEGAQNREAQELGHRSSSIPLQIIKNNTLKCVWTNAEDNDALYPNLTHEVNGEKYNFTVKYMGYDDPIPQKGYGVGLFVASNYIISSEVAPPKKGVRIRSRYYTIIPNPNGPQR